MVTKTVTFETLDVSDGAERIASLLEQALDALDGCAKWVSVEDRLPEPL